MELLFSRTAIRGSSDQSGRSGINVFDALGTLLILYKDKTAIAQNITNQARYAKALFIWTDCDREGEYIGAEVRQAAFKGNARLEIKRAQFSNTERA